jgi:hypothetical protein
LPEDVESLLASDDGEDEAGDDAFDPVLVALGY